MKKHVCNYVSNDKQVTHVPINDACVKPYRVKQEGSSNSDGMTTQPTGMSPCGTTALASSVCKINTSQKRAGSLWYAAKNVTTDVGV